MAAKKSSSRKSTRKSDTPQTVPTQDPANNPTPQKLSALGESHPHVSAALTKEQEKLVVGIEPSRADTVLKDAAQWPTEAHKVTTVEAGVGVSNELTPEVSPA